MVLRSSSFSHALKGVYTKLGQHIASLVHIVPKVLAVRTQRCFRSTLLGRSM